MSGQTKLTAREFDEAMEAGAFMEWLSTPASPICIVGIRRKTCLCPIALYLKVVLDRKMVSVGMKVVRFNKYAHPLPYWAQRFIEITDVRRFNQKDGITKSEALKALCEARE